MNSFNEALDRSGAEAVQPKYVIEDLPPHEAQRVARAVALVESVYGSKRLGTGEEIWPHVLGMAQICATLRLDADTRLAALLFAMHDQKKDAGESIEAEFGPEVARLVYGLHRLHGLRLITGRTATLSPTEERAQREVLRKMILALVEDIRVVLLRLSSRTQTLRYLVGHPGPERDEAARESLDIYAPLANRLGVWQIKWELEDLSFRFLEPETYSRIAEQLEEQREERELFIAHAITQLQAECVKVGIKAEITGRPKHIYSIWKKMRYKQVDFSEVYDVRALRVIVERVEDCYTVLSLVHQLWEPVAKEFDDYIAKPKANFYRSLHTAVIAGDDRPLEVQIRTIEMHRHAESGVASHWRYKEGTEPTAREDAYGEKLALLRELLSWRDEVEDASQWRQQFKLAALDDTIYVLTPQGRVIDLPQGATPIDFAYRVHTQVGHRCRGAKVDGALVPLNTRLASGQKVEIVTAKQGGPSRDWLNPQLGYIRTGRARGKVKQWFLAAQEAQRAAEGRTIVQRELQRLGATQANIETLATDLGFTSAESMYLAAGRGKLGPRAIQLALREPNAEPAPPREFIPRKSRAQTKDDSVLIVGVDKLLTQLGGCCKPVPPDPIEGYVTRGKGVSIHRTECRNFTSMARDNPERVVAASWGRISGEANTDNPLYPAEIAVECTDRTGLLHDITEVLSRENINITAVQTLSRKGTASMSFTIEVAGLPQLKRAVKLLEGIPSVVTVRRA
jgi:GTP pyrophosphokinase